MRSCLTKSNKCDQLGPGGTHLRSFSTKLPKCDQPAPAGGTNLGSCMTKLTQFATSRSQGDKIGILILHLRTSSTAIKSITANSLSPNYSFLAILHAGSNRLRLSGRLHYSTAATWQCVETTRSLTSFPKFCILHVILDEVRFLAHCVILLNFLEGSGHYLVSKYVYKNCIRDFFVWGYGLWIEKLIPSARHSLK